MQPELKVWKLAMSRIPSIQDYKFDLIAQAFDATPLPIAIFNGEDFLCGYFNRAHAAHFEEPGPLVHSIYNAYLFLPSKKLQEIIDLVRRGHRQIVNPSESSILQQYSLSLVFSPIKTGDLFNGILVFGQIQEPSADRSDPEDNFHKLVLQAPFAIAVLKGPDHIIDMVNSRMIQLWGKSESELIQRPVFEAIPEARGIGLESRLASVLNNGETIEETERALYLKRKGREELVYINYVYEPFRENDGQISGVIVVAIEVTEQVHARQEIESAEAKARLAIELADLGTYELDLRNDHLVTSERFNEIFGVNSNPGRAELAASIHPEDIHLRNKAHELSRKTGLLEYEVRLQIRNGSLRWIRVRGRVIFDENKNPVRLMGVVLDITEQKLFTAELHKIVEERTKELMDMNSKLERSNAELEQFAYITSHDLQEPLRKIQVFNSILKDKISVKDEGKKYIEKIGDSAKRMSGLIRDLLDYSRISTSNQGFEKVDLNQVVKNVLSDFELLIAQKKAEIYIEPLGIIEGIPLQVNQMIYNLVGNALKFSRPDQTPLINIKGNKLSPEDLALYPALNSETEYYSIIFTDNGIGFDQHYSDRIFTIFQRLNQNKDFGGYGIGLALCRKIVINHKGVIFAEGKEMEGARFTVILPLRQSL